MPEVYGDNNDVAVATSNDVDMTYSDLYANDENAMDFYSIYNSPHSPDRIATADEIALMVDDDDVRNQQRLLHIASFGPVRVVTPTPSFIMKTKRHSGTKIFVNVCTHDLVPFNLMDSGAMVNGSNTVLIYMVVSAPSEHTNEKDGSYCVVYDVAVNDKVISVSSNDDSGGARAMVSSISVFQSTIIHSFIHTYIYTSDLHASFGPDISRIQRGVGLEVQDPPREQQLQGHVGVRLVACEVMRRARRQGFPFSAPALHHPCRCGGHQKHSMNATPRINGPSNIGSEFYAVTK